MPAGMPYNAVIFCTVGDQLVKVGEITLIARKLMLAKELILFASLEQQEATKSYVTARCC